MKNGVLTAFAWLGVVAAGVSCAQDKPASVYDLLGQPPVVAAASAATVGQRAAAYPSLEILPRDVDSFFVLTRLHEWTDLLMAQCEALPIRAMMADFRLDSFAAGCSAVAAQDLARLVKILKLIEDPEAETVNEWVDAAQPDVARAIVGQRRALQQARGEQLVELTRDFQQAPLHVVLSCKPGGEAVMKQLSVLLMMIPVEVEGPLGLLMQGSRRGFYIDCDKFDLSRMELLPEHELQIMQNLHNKRLYFMSEVRGRHLVLSLCTDMNAVQLPATPADSMLSADTVAAYDDMLHRNTYAIAHSHPELVNAGREVNMMEYTTGMQFLQEVFKTLAPDNSAAAAAGGAVERLLRQVVNLLPAKQSADSLRVWKDGDWFIRFDEDACGRQFAPGRLGVGKCSAAENAIFFAESTPLQGVRMEDCAAMLQDIQTVHDGVLATLKPDSAARMEKEAQVPEWLRRLGDSAARVLQCALPVLSGECTLLLHETGDSTEPTQLSLCAGTVPNDGAHAAAWQEVSQAFATLPESTRRCWSLNPDSRALVFSTAATAPADLYPQPGENLTPGGAVFSFNLQALARVSVLMASAEKTQKAREQAKEMLQLAQWIERLEGACSVRNNRVYYTFRIKQAE